jgi:hypothetical protein
MAFLEWTGQLQLTALARYTTGTPQTDRRPNSIWPFVAADLSAVRRLIIHVVRSGLAETA